MKVEIGMRVYNAGDICNPPHKGTVTKIISSPRFADQVEITRDEPMEGFEDSYIVEASMIGEEYRDHSTRIVTEFAYDVWVLEKIANLGLKGGQS